ncbi:MAG: protein kinase, partial [Deltaproteobacteria bacterium]|nr:protein kinase [Deltaproteobacteria bacterium]
MTASARNATDQPWLLEPGTRVDHFKVLRPLGSGGMAEVYLARDQKLGRKVALKWLKPGVLDAAAKERFLFEARATARFSHPHIVAIHDVGEHDGTPYVALEYVVGPTLRERMAADPLGVAEVVRLALAVARALAEAHASQIQHRDLKPENIMLASDGRPRVLDFGLAQVFEHERAAPEEGASSQGDDLLRSRVVDPFASMASGVRGSPAYMAPERWRMEPSGGAADVWSFGVILYELLAEKRPFESPSLATLVAEVCSDLPSPALEPRQPIAAELGDLIAQCLDKDPDGRPSALELVQSLEKLQRGGRPSGGDEESPFRGLLPFTEQHADLFFGRDAEIASFVERLRSLPVMPVLGPSGVGKSSFVQAGVVPRLRERGPLVVVQTRPGRTPFVSLAARVVAARRQATGSGTGTPFGVSTEKVDAAAIDSSDEAERLATQLRASPHLLNVVLSRLAEQRKSNLLLFVDQLEELATLVPDEDERLAYMQAICTAADDPALPVRAVMTLREEFLSRLARGRGVREAMGQVTVLQSPAEKSLTEIVQRPVQARGYAFDDPALIAEMVAAVKDEVACLPLLQFVGQKIWEGRDRTKRLLTRDAYRSAGGVTGALARHADAIVAGMTTAEANLARSLLLRLVTPEGTRRVLTRERLLEVLDPAAGEVLQRLVDGRLVTVRQAEADADEARAESESDSGSEARSQAETPTRTGAQTEAGAEHELAHESLVMAWDRFRRWIEESREELVFLDEVGRAAELWEKRGRRSDEVWTGDALAEAWRAVGKCASEVPSHVIRFLQASRRKEQRRLWQRRALVAAVIVALAAVALVFAFKERETGAQKARAVAGEAEALLESASVALAGGDLLEARSRLRSSLEGADSTAGRMLWRRLQANALDLRLRLADHPTDVAFEPGGSSIVAIDYSGQGYRIDLTTARVEKFEAVEGRAVRALARDASWIAFGRTSGQVVLRDLKTGLVRELGAHAGPVSGLLASADGRWLASGGFDAEVRLWDVAAGQLRHTLTGHSEVAMPQAFGAGGRKLVSAGR